MLIPIIVFLIGLTGAVTLAFGSWLIYEPAGYLVAGSECLLWSFMMSLALSRKANRKESN